MEKNDGMTDRGKPKNSKEKPVSVPLCPPQIPHGFIPAPASAQTMASPS
jgi:hypothetical protein